MGNTRPCVARALLSIDDDVMPEQRGEFLAGDAADHVDRAAGRHRNYQPDRPLGIRGRTRPGETNQCRKNKNFCHRGPRVQWHYFKPSVAGWKNSMIVDSTADRRVDRAQRNPPNAEGITRGSSNWWIPAQKAPASTLPEA